MNKVLHRLLMAGLGTAAIFTINTLNTLTQASATAKFDTTEIHPATVLPVAVPGQNILDFRF
jgi:hypothetical protein